MTENSAEVESTEDLIRRWFRRMQRSHAIYIESFRDEAFEDLVAVLVTTAFVERVLLVGVQLAGLFVDPNKKFSFTLGQLLRIGTSQGWISRDLRRLLPKLGDISNNFAHDIDYRLTAETVAELRALLPAESEAEIRPALANIFPEPSTGVIAVLVYEQIAALAFHASQEAGQ
jgi:hypothetical protein